MLLSSVCTILCFWSLSHRTKCQTTRINEIKSPGVIIDRRLSFNLQVAAIARACNYQHCALQYIRRLDSVDVAKMLACSIVSVRPD